MLNNFIVFFVPFQTQVVRVLGSGLIPEIPDIEVDCPKVHTYVGEFLVELFQEEPNLNWLVDITDSLTKKSYQDMVKLVKSMRISLEEKKSSFNGSRKTYDRFYKGFRKQFPVIFNPTNPF